MLFSLTNPIISLPNLLHEFEIYGVLSNLKITFAKSEAMGVGKPQPLLSHLQACFKLKWTKYVLKYLVMFIPPKFSQLFDLNLPPLLKTVRTLLNTWHTGLHLWFGHCNILKMNILTKVLYLFHALPIYIPSRCFKQTQSLTLFWPTKDHVYIEDYFHYPNNTRFGSARHANILPCNTLG